MTTIEAWQKLTEGGIVPSCVGACTSADLQSYLEFVYILVFVLGLPLVVMGVFLYAGGLLGLGSVLNKKEFIENGRKAMVNATIGFGIALLAWVGVNTVFTALTDCTGQLSVIRIEKGGIKTGIECGKSAAPASDSTGLAKKPVTSEQVAGKVSGLAANILYLLSATFFSLALLMFLWAGSLFLTGGGDPKKIEAAKTRLIQSLIGLTIGLVAYAMPAIIASFLKGAVTEITTNPSPPASSAPAAPLDPGNI